MPVSHVGDFPYRLAATIHCTDGVARLQRWTVIGRTIQEQFSLTRGKPGLKLAGTSAAQIRDFITANAKGFASNDGLRAIRVGLAAFHKRQTDTLAKSAANLSVNGSFQFAPIHHFTS
ncbi:hypothetical protein [Agrobacterium rosae]|uniref:hypothetical protein n=1 Tax=Agrobacterium rosae TaxID=1972867 RepID=UPI0020333F0A|nr:hypothetical protein [Agrobacterium rosae]MCM2434136.1 hypothetical protein [Agrobacterium rosae]